LFPLYQHDPVAVDLDAARMVRAVLGFKALRSAAITIADIEIMHMIRKGQLRSTGKLRPAQQFYSLAA
jgi:putative transposase